MCRSPLWTRLLEGALNRVPSDFYLRLYLLLERAPGGVRCWSYTLPQQPTLGDMEPDDLDFQLLVDQVCRMPLHINLFFSCSIYCLVRFEIENK